MSTNSSDSENLPEIQEIVELQKKSICTKSLIFVGIVIWSLAFATVSYHCIESELHRQGISVPVTETEGRKFNASKTNTTPTDNRDSSQEKNRVVHFQQFSQDSQEQKTSKSYKNFKDRASKLAAHKSNSNRQQSTSAESSLDNHRKENGNAILANSEVVEENSKRMSSSQEETSVEESSEGDDNEANRDLGVPQNIIPEISSKNSESSDGIMHTIPELPPFYNLGEIRSISSNTLCLDASSVDGSVVTLYDCHGQGGNQNWDISENDELKKDRLCGDYFGGPLFMFECHGSKGNQKWLYSTKEKVLQHPISNTCLSIADGSKLSMKPCNGKLEQKWWWRKGYHTSHLSSVDNEL